MSLSINSFDSDSINTLFSSLSSSSSKSTSSSTGLESLLSDYSSLKSGSYGKLLKAYYSLDDSSSTSSNSSSKDTSKLSSLKNDASSMVDAADKLLDNSSSLWSKVSTTDEDGNEILDYDRDAIYDSISSFIDSYNDLVDSGQDSDNTGILTQVASMVTTTNNAISTLGQVGITVSSDNHLSINESFFKSSADMTVAKSLFNGTGSYLYQVTTKASMVKSYANSNLADLTGSKAYSSTGDYSLSTSDLLSSLNKTV